ncbi:hypothetical protein CIL05_03600 [Virgibacillus profundi]|uniref:Uncharacterized protein n=1 Tax=Virgibacillus profundi TaxID=2024555 RepID=A0A2A2IGP4_9BACI|nr:hypothetical protein [Virgibacillus profundi]PAV30817.1 hypothetical protein CIL05_03600 [Virgibacillus profundi]PXY55000.1 hypothetical protein CIT14_03680 [Virgibacillus profundi]
MKKLNEHEAKLLKEIICENNAIFEMGNCLYNVSMVDAKLPARPKNKSETTKVQQKYEQTKLDILNGKNFSIDEVVEMMDCGAL